MVWIARLKLSHHQVAPLSAVRKMIGDGISKSGYLNLKRSEKGRLRWVRENVAALVGLKLGLWKQELSVSPS
jgi:hypothetical protein